VVRAGAGRARSGQRATRAPLAAPDPVLRRRRQPARSRARGGAGPAPSDPAARPARAPPRRAGPGRRADLGLGPGPAAGEVAGLGAGVAHDLTRVTGGDTCDGLRSARASIPSAQVSPRSRRVLLAMAA